MSDVIKGTSGSAGSCSPAPLDTCTNDHMSCCVASRVVTMGPIMVPRFLLSNTIDEVSVTRKWVDQG